MEENYQYPVFFECDQLLDGQKKKKVERYFCVRQKSGGGDCGSLTRVADHVYSIAFKNQKDQQEVLKRAQHEVDLTGSSLVFTVKGSLSPPSTSHDTTPTAPAESQQSIPVSSALLNGKELEEQEIFSLKAFPVAEEVPTSGYYSAEHYQEKEETLRKGLSQVTESRRRILILGKTGAGKSNVGNTIFGEDQFSVCHSLISSKSLCQAKTKSVNGREITLIDTPGFFDTNISEEEMKSEMLKCITECSPGPHAFLIILKLERFTEQENDIINKITQYFSKEVFRFATIVFTHGDQLPEHEKLQGYLDENVLLRELLRKCGRRYHVVDNKYWDNSRQVTEILQSIEEIVNANNGECYINEMLQAVEETIQEEVQRIAQSPGNEEMPKEEFRQKAKYRVWELLIKAAGITAGITIVVLLGALFGNKRACKAVLAALKTAIIETANVGLTVGVEVAAAAAFSAFKSKNQNTS